MIFTQLVCNRWSTLLASATSDWNRHFHHKFMTWKHFPYYRPVAEGIHRSLVNFLPRRPAIFYVFSDVSFYQSVFMANQHLLIQFIDEKLVISFYLNQLPNSLQYIWVRSWNCGCLVTWFCYQLIAKPGNKTASVLWSDPYAYITSAS